MTMRSSNREKSKIAWRRAAEVMPLGVNSNFRYWGDDETFVIERAKGAYICDIDSTRYIDYSLGFGPVILGHAYEEGDARVRDAIQRRHLCLHQPVGDQRGRKDRHHVPWSGESAPG